MEQFGKAVAGVLLAATLAFIVIKVGQGISSTVDQKSLPSCQKEAVEA